VAAAVPVSRNKLRGDVTGTDVFPEALGYRVNAGVVKQMIVGHAVARSSEWLKKGSRFKIPDFIAPGPFIQIRLIGHAKM
jgi:hypothetical protein